MRPQRAGTAPLDPPSRAALVVAAFALAGLLAVASRLEPDPRGYGTHERLGLPPCGVARLQGVPCPTCGMTTAYAWFVRGRFAPAWRANPAGLGLAAASLGLIPWLLGSALRGRPWGTRTIGRPLALLLVVGTALALLAWFLRLDPGRAS